MPPRIDIQEYTHMDRIYTRPDGHVEVYRGDVEGFDTIIKIASEPDVVASLQREADILRKLDGSEHAPALYDIGHNPDTGKTYLAMERVEGDKLDETLGMDGQWTFPRISPESALNLTAGIAQADHDLLSHGIFYRDLNPNHIIIKPNGNIAFIDFGAAEVSNANLKEWTVTDDGRNGGTWEFMAPEEFRPGNTLNEATAVYRLGVLAHMLLTGSLPVPRFGEIDEAKAWSEDSHFTLSDHLTPVGQAFFAKIFTTRPENIEKFITELKELQDDLVLPPGDGAPESV